MSIAVVVNGEEKMVPEAADVTHAVALFAGGEVSGRGIAVAVNGEVVPRSRWPEVALRAGDRVEVLRAVGGG